MKTAFSIILAIILCFNGNLSGQISRSDLKTAILQSRKLVDGRDNYADAAFSFEKGTNGESAKQLTRNDWDVYFYTIYRNDGSIVRDVLDVSMVTDDRSRIRDLGELNWDDDFVVPKLPAYEIPIREKGADAVAGHIYLVHTKDRDTDLYALFRVDKLETGESAAISWKIIPSPEKK